jgi:DNA primase
MNSPVQKIKERLSIEDVVSSYIKLDRVGINFKAKCPFHNEKTPSFFVSPERGSYYCFGCGAKGDIFTFVEEFEGLDFRGALKLLADKAGVTLEHFDPKEESEKEKLYRIMETATLFFEKNLVNTQNALSYLKNRGLNDESVKNFRIGYIRNDWRELYSYLKKNYWQDSDIVKAGLAKKTEKGFYDRFRGRIMFPISDSSGRVIAFSGRIFPDDQDNDQKSAKYLNSPDTLLFSKSTVLYGLDKAKESIRKNNFSILVEGQLDLVLSHQAGFKNTVATSGTALSDISVSKENLVSNLGLVRRLSNNIVIAFDADRAGFEASGRAARIALSLGMDVKVAQMPEGVDPADLISKKGSTAWHEAIKHSTHIIEFVLDKILKDYANDARKITREIKEKILPYVDALESAMEKTHFIKKISDVSSISEEALKDDLKKITNKSVNERREVEDILEKESEIFRRDYIEQRLLSIIFWQKSLAEPVIKVESILQKFADILKSEPSVILGMYKDKSEDLIYEAEVFYGQETTLEKDIQELFYNLEEEYINEELLRKLRELNIVEVTHDKIKITEVMTQINELTKRKQDIKNGRSQK